MTQHAQTIEAVIGSAAGLTVLGGVAVRLLIKPLNRVADRVESAVKVVEGTPAVEVNGFVVVERRPGMVEQFTHYGDVVGRVETGVAGLYPRVEKLEKLILGQN